ncbi:DUF6473 family protein [Ruegeria sp. ANG-S4]|uniref:DUF6473 family protein n=1 Tax=Ruegeria sp. ANG-S4 TaxID=1577904 RepID=UPI001F4CF4EA|nr:DUF6473 family protein [Ruegeria sp. ANG-S4]
MSYQPMAAENAVESFCRYGQSNLWFRGPQRSLDKPFVACIGGQETFGRFVEDPFPARLERLMQRRCLNFGSLFCGVDAVHSDDGLRELADRAEICVLQLPGLAGQNNRFYRVHARRNDRFVAPTQDLITLFPEADFTDIHFVRHLMNRLYSISGDRHAEVVDELRRNWVARLRGFLQSVSSQTVLLWLDVQNGSLSEGPIEHEHVRAEMLDALRPFCADAITLTVRVAGDSDELEDLLFGTLQQPRAEFMLGPATHQKIADALSQAIQNLRS